MPCALSFVLRSLTPLLLRVHRYESCSIRLISGTACPQETPFLMNLWSSFSMGSWTNLECYPFFLMLPSKAAVLVIFSYFSSSTTIHRYSIPSNCTQGHASGFIRRHKYTTSKLCGMYRLLKSQIPLNIGSTISLNVKSFFSPTMIFPNRKLPPIRYLSVNWKQESKEESKWQRALIAGNCLILALTLERLLERRREAQTWKQLWGWLRSIRVRQQRRATSLQLQSPKAEQQFSMDCQRSPHVPPSATVLLKSADRWGEEESKMQCFSVRERDEQGSRAFSEAISASGESSFFIPNLLFRTHSLEPTRMNGNKEQQVPQQLQNAAHARPSRILSLIHSPSLLQAIRHSHILVVGAGGIGCELIKNLSRSGVTHISLIDYDRIEETNLNRQFYFRPSHIGLPKTDILKQVMVQFGMHITAYNVDLFEQELPHSFWNSLTLIISALDSIKARQELSRLAMKFNKALVDAGTLGFNGQVTSTVRFSSNCHNCQQEQPEESYAACTIRNSPTLNRHVGVYAKNFFEAYFSDESLLLSELNYKQSSCPKRIFGVLFSGLPSPVRSLSYEDVVAHPQLYMIPTTKSIYEEDSLHDLPYYCRNFVSTLETLTQERREHQFSLEKDNHTMVLLLTCIFNLRVYNYQPTSPQLKYLTYYQCKDLITKVYFAIASANSIAAGLQATQSYKLIKAVEQHTDPHGNEALTQNSLYISFVNFSEERLQPSYLPEPNPECLFCSRRVIYGQVEADLEERTFEQLDEFLSNRFYTYHRKMYHKEAILWHPAQKGRRLNHFSHLFKHGQIDLECRPIQCMTPLKVNVLLIHSKTEGFTVKEQYNPARKQISQQLIRYLEEREKDDMLRLAEEVKRYGVC